MSRRGLWFLRTDGPSVKCRIKYVFICSSTREREREQFSPNELNVIRRGGCGNANGESQACNEFRIMRISSLSDENANRRERERGRENELENKEGWEGSLITLSLGFSLCLCCQCNDEILRRVSGEKTTPIEERENEDRVASSFAAQNSYITTRISLVRQKPRGRWKPSSEIIPSPTCIHFIHMHSSEGEREHRENWLPA